MAGRLSEYNSTEPFVIELVEKARQEVSRRLGPKATFEQRREVTSAVIAEALAKYMDSCQEEDQSSESPSTAGAAAPCEPRARESQR